MRKLIDEKILLAAALIAFSIIFYFIHYSIFRNAHHIFIFMLSDIAFVPIEILLVTFIINELISAREKRQKIMRLNMVIGVFFSELGAELIQSLVCFHQQNQQIKEKIISIRNWQSNDFITEQKEIMNANYYLQMTGYDLEKLLLLLKQKRGILISLIQNPNLSEHESFTDLILAVLHASEELIHRANYGNITEVDREHLVNDIDRVYKLLLYEWLGYMKHLKEDYPYLFSLASRLNPCDPRASAEIK